MEDPKFIHGPTDIEGHLGKDGKFIQFQLFLAHMCRAILRSRFSASFPSRATTRWTIKEVMQLSNLYTGKVELQG